MPDAPALLLLPTPRSLIRVGPDLPCPPALAAAVNAFWANPASSPSPDIRITSFDEQPSPDSYSLRIAANDEGHPAISIRATPRSRRHAAATLRQLLRLCPGHLPQVEIEDAPSFSTRGFMLDISRDKVPTMSQLKSTIDLLSELKFNHFQLYTEHTFAYAGHEDVWTDASPLTPDEARELDRYAAGRGVELAANQNCFGHLASWLKLPRYQPLAEIAPDGVWKFLHWDRRGPFSLCPIEPKAEAFIVDLLGQLLPRFSSPLVNINCDETFDVGFGRSHAEAERRGGGDAQAGRVALYFDFVSRIARICERRGKRPMMWADIALSHPESLHLMPRGMIGLAWWYEPTDKFARWIELLREHGHEAWVCPGTSSWRSFTGRTTERRANIADAADQGLAAGATGFMVCDWGDVGHRQQWPISLAGIAQTAEAAWNAPSARTFDPRAASLHVFDDATLTLGPWLDQLGDADLHIRRRARVSNATALFNDLHPPVPEALKPGERQINAPLEDWSIARANLDRLATSVPPIADRLMRDELRHTLDVATFAADHAIAARQSPPFDTSARNMLADRLSGLTAEHKRLWLARNRPGGLPHATSYYRNVLKTLTGESGE